MSMSMSMFVQQIPFSFSSHHLFHGRSRCGSGVSPHTISISRVSSSSSSICLCLCVPYWKEYFPFSTEKEKQQQQHQRRRHHHLHSPNSNGNDDMHSPGHEGSNISNGTQPEKAFTFNELMQRLKRYGISGVLSYGLLNTVYYLSTFLLVWFYIAPAPGRMGYAAAVERFLKVMAMVWAGSQVTKLVRAAGALALAPIC
ncbi:putative transmembrane protein [Cinnamomum micranthum f. kanehirae]|uniref:Putative transmembrane protein n=1 Tax=Cinnamomum micranthum f. kanehirae TaxID=337451 RepID=A0A443N9J6_9MAGN|nr:putative transmembrane protein [Cinnamomum micranthum f. kanehirae]